MPDFDSYPHGKYCWIDLRTTDPAAAAAFYTGLFGLDSTTMELPLRGAYTMLTKRGRTVGGITGLSEEQRSQGVPSHWLSHLAVDDVAAALASAVSAGGTALTAIMDFGADGRGAGVADPTGAVFGIWQAGEMPGAGVANEHGALVWNELITNDPDAAGAFYEEILPWTPHVYDMPTGPYTMWSGPGWKEGDNFEAGMMRLPPQMEGMPSAWGVYFQVDDVDGIVASVEELGGSQIAPAFDVEGVGRFAVFADPTGGVFSVMEPMATP